MAYNNDYYNGYRYSGNGNHDHLFFDGFNRGCEAAALAALQIGLGAPHRNCDDDRRRRHDDDCRCRHDEGNGNDDDIITFYNGYGNMNIYRNPNFRANQRNERRNDGYCGYY